MSESTDLRWLSSFIQNAYYVDLSRYLHFYRATACNATHGIAVEILPVCLSVRQSVRRVYCDKTE